MKGSFSFLAFTPKKRDREEGSDLKMPVCNGETSEAVFWGKVEGKRGEEQGFLLISWPDYFPKAIKKISVF